MSFTKNLWKKLWSGECESGHDAVRRHRRIFFDWAFFREPQAELFRVLVRAPSTDEEFFRSVYITDIWKDGAFKTNRKRSNPGYREHWRSLLAGELRGTRPGSTLTSLLAVQSVIGQQFVGVCIEGGPRQCDCFSGSNTSCQTSSYD